MTEAAAIEGQSSPTPDAVATAITGDEAEIFCPQCGYSLRGIGSAERCPECGLAIDRAGFSRTRIPWVYRAHIGRVRAWWRTVWLATLRPGQLAMESARPVSYRDAQRFRLVTSVVAALPFALLMSGVMIEYGGPGVLNVTAPAVFANLMFGGGMAPGGPAPVWLNLLIPWEAGATLPPVLPLAFFVAMSLVTGVASYWFHPGGLPVVRQNRAIALSHYACAPLAFVAVPVGAFVALAMLQKLAMDDPRHGFGPLITFFGVVACIGVAGVAFLVIRSTLVLLRRTTQSSLARVGAAAASLPLLWGACAALALVGIPWVIGFVRLVITSLWG